jgi:hypothetical protein
MRQKQLLTIDVVIFVMPKGGKNEKHFNENTAERERAPGNDMNPRLKVPEADTQQRVTKKKQEV